MKIDYSIIKWIFVVSPLSKKMLKSNAYTVLRSKFLWRPKSDILLMWKFSTYCSSDFRKKKDKIFVLEVSFFFFKENFD